jgi:hypothetical protein
MHCSSNNVFIFVNVTKTLHGTKVPVLDKQLGSEDPPWLRIVAYNKLGSGGVVMSIRVAFFAWCKQDAR